MRPGSTWIDNSTTDRDETARLAALAAAQGVRMLEAPVTGGVHKAAAGEITVLVGGDEALYDEHRRPAGRGRRARCCTWARWAAQR